EIILHSSEGEINLMNGRFYPTPILQELNPKISTEQLKRIVEKDLKSKNVEVFESDLIAEPYVSELVIYHPKRDKNAEKLCYHVSIRPNAMQLYEYFVNAISGEIIHQFNHTCNFTGNRIKHEHKKEVWRDGSENASAADLFGIKRDVKAYLSAGAYYLIDASRTMFKPALSQIPNKPVGAINTLDALNTSPEKSSFKYTNVKSLDNKWTGQSTAISAHYNAGISYNYFKTVHARESINGKGGTINSIVNVAEKNGGSLENAFWNGETMYYGNGGSAFFPLARSLDVAGHELTHGVVQNTANLEYENESGAMNESYADMFGAMIDRDDWKIGEDVVKASFFPSGALRDMSNPHNGGTNINSPAWQPNHMNEKYKGTDDNGGVHINSGIPNFAFFKYATALNKEKAEKVFFRALEKYLVRSSQFIDLRAAVQQAATDLFGAGTNEVNQVAIAFAAVGIGGGGSSTGSGYQTDIKTNPGSDVVLFSDNDYSTVSLYFPATNKSIKITDTDINSRPSVMDNGAYMVFVASDKTIHGINLNWVNGTFAEEVISAEKVWRNVAISKDGLRLAATLDQEENVIYVYDFSKSPAKQKSFVLTNPTHTTGISTGEVQYCDAMDFDLTGENIMYDAFNKLNGSNGSSLDYWDIGIINVYDNKTKTFATGNIEKLFSDIEEGSSVGNPSFSKNSPHIIAFDYQVGFDQNKTYIYTVNLQTGDIGEIYYNGKDVLGFPTFSRTDDRLLFETEDALGNFAGSIGLNPDKLSAKTSTPAEVVNEARWPLWFSNGTRILVDAKDIASEQYQVFPNPFKESITIVFKQYGNQIKPYQLIDIMGRVQLSGTLSQETTNIDMSNLASGTYFFKIENTVRKLIKF
ncbi:MAG: M4 family metallopeptidase, partial [Saprospiraceae bacterium]